jgi:EAL domain-containing protein (putative c-di-GMP-specific phosphodiesterase class I)
LIQPSRFIPIAEESGLIIDINRWVIRAACEQNTRWQESGFDPVRVAVNLSGYRIAGQNIIDVIQEVLLDTDLDATNLELEITENILMQDTKDTILLLKQMKDLNLRIAMDDFGTGYSSLSYLASFPVDIIKIDRSFVMGCTMQKTNLIIIKAIIAMGESLGMKIVAEGIETEEQYNIMKSHGAHEGQGFFFAPPVSQQEFGKLLAKGIL